ncbi:MAG: Flp pilus assembly complex ATPase component [Candidatus Micrarchaeota archaeon]|nr:Flp pilus assembly complex ATPase component [Candidatus Micrarchaeota archaeon]
MEVGILKKYRPREIEEKIKKVVPDTSAIIHGKLTELVESGELDGAEIIFPEIVIGELQAQASRGKEIGFIGLDEIRKIKEMAKEHRLKIKFVGERPSYEDILLAKSGRIDALIQDVAKKEKAVLVTSDLPQALVAEAEGIGVKYFEPYPRERKLKLENFLTEDTMSLHLKEGVVPMAKRGVPGKMKLVKLGNKPLDKEELEGIIKEIMDASRYEEDAFVEYGEHGATVVQLRDLRIAITRPPFSDGLEVTVVRPTVKLTLDDYRLSERLKKRLYEKAEGILVAGPPGSGKSTFTASLAEFYMKEKQAVVKTLESPKDLQLPREITQYGPLNGSFVKTADILLLVRPDYSIFDEIRKPSDFSVFTELRLAGIGMIGVIHATDPISAVQRFIGKVELGLIPHVVDTIIFIKDGEIKKVYSLSLTVRVPSGMTDSDLARPLVEVRDFETGKIEYEIYTYGEENVVIPVTEEKTNPVIELAKERIKQEIRRFDPGAEVNIIGEKAVIKIRNEAIPKIIGKQGKTIASLERKLGIQLEVEPAVTTLGKEVKFQIGESGAYVVLVFQKKLSGNTADIYVNGDYLFSATIGRNGQIKVSKNSELGKKLISLIAAKKKLRAFISS